MAEHEAEKPKSDVAVDYRPTYWPYPNVPDTRPLDVKGKDAVDAYLFNRRVARESNEREGGR